MQASSDGSKYETIFDHAAKAGGAWQTYSFEPFRAKYIKPTFNLQVQLCG